MDLLQVLVRGPELVLEARTALMSSWEERAKDLKNQS